MDRLITGTFFLFKDRRAYNREEGGGGGGGGLSPRF